MKTLISLALLVVGYLVAFYAGFCLLGGPDGAILSRSSLVFGVLSLIASALLILVSAKFASFGGYAYTPLAVVIVAWLVVIANFQKAGFFVWLYGTAIASAAAFAYCVFVQFSSRRS